MCVAIPAAAMAAISAATTVASAALSIRGQQIQRKTQAALQDRATKAATQQHAAKVSAIRARQNQEAIIVSRQIQEQSRRATEAKARGRTAAFEAGTSGTNVNALLADFNRKFADFRSTARLQQRMADHNKELAMKDAGLQWQQNWIDINQPLPQVDYAGAVVDVGRGLAGASRQYARDMRIQKGAQSV